MNSLDKTDREICRRYYLPPKDEGLINKTLPVEVFRMILSYVDDREMQTANTVNSTWCKESVISARCTEFLKIDNFLNFLYDHIQKEIYPIQSKNLLRIETDLKDSINLRQVKSSILKLKIDIVTILKDLKEEDLNRLESLFIHEPSPKFFENLFALTRIYKETDEANQLPPKERSFAIEKISYKLIDCGEIDKAIEIALTITEDLPKEYALRKICISLTNRHHHDKKGRVRNLNRAIKIAKLIPDAITEDIVISLISEKFMFNGCTIKAIKVANKIGDEQIRNDNFVILNRIKIVKN